MYRLYSEVAVAKKQDVSFEIAFEVTAFTVWLYPLKFLLCVTLTFRLITNFHLKDDIFPTQL